MHHFITAEVAELAEVVTSNTENQEKNKSCAWGDHASL